MHAIFRFTLAVIGLFGLCQPAFADDVPRRVITVGAPATEIVFALGAGNDVIATDTTSTRPDPVSSLPKVGYMRQLASEGIVSLKPDLVVAVEKAGPDPVLQELADLGIKIVKLPSLDQMGNLPDAITIAADSLGRQDQATLLNAQIKSDIASLANLATEKHPSIVFLMVVGHGKPLAAGNKTTAAEIIDLIGGRNTMADFDGFKPVSSEIIAADTSDYVLITQSTIDQLGGIEGLKNHPVLGLNKAVANGHVLTVSSSTILGFGPSSASEIRAMATSLHQQSQLEQ